MDEDVSAEKLSNGLWVWICQPWGGSAFYQSGPQFKRRADAVKAGIEFAASAR